MSKRPRSSRAKAYGLLLVNAALWGIAPPIIKVALKYATINQFLFARYLIASLIFLPIFFLQKKRLKLNAKYILLALLGTPLTLIPLYEGIKLTTSIEASLLYATIPVMVVLGGWLFLKEKIEKHEKVGLSVALAGTLLLVIEPILSGQARIASFSLLGNFLILISNLVWTAFLLLAKKFKTDASQISVTSYLVSVPFFLFGVLAQPAASANPFHPLALFGIIYMAIFGSVIAFWAYTKGQSLIEAGEASIFTYLQPLFTFPVAFLWLGETISSLSLAAAAVIAVGVYLSEYRHR